MADIWGKIWWAWQGLNLRPLRCQRKADRAKAPNSDNFLAVPRETQREQITKFEPVYRSLTAMGAA